MDDGLAQTLAARTLGCQSGTAFWPDQVHRLSSAAVKRRVPCGEQ